MALPGALEIETATLTAWPALFVAYDGRWVWRAARGYSNRSNSINCLDPADGVEALQRIARLTELYTRHGLPPVFKITPLTAPAIGTALDTLDWQRYGESHVLAMQMHPRGVTPAHHTALYDPLDPVWLTAQADMHGYGSEIVETLKAVLTHVPCDHRGVLAFDANGVPAAAALAYVAHGMAVFTNVVSRPSHRGQGFGRAVMAAGLNWTRDAGAVTAGIQVAAGNEPALRLYGSLGFVHAYDYHYRRPRSAA